MAIRYFTFEAIMTKLIDRYTITKIVMKHGKQVFIFQRMRNTQYANYFNSVQYLCQIADGTV